MIKTLIIIVTIVVVSALTTFYLSSIYFQGVIHEKAEEERLQNLAFVQLLSGFLDRNDTQLLRETVDSNLTASLVQANPENSYNYMYSEACKIHQLIYEYRANHSEQYRLESPEEQMAQKVLEYWQGKDCEK